MLTDTRTEFVDPGFSHKLGLQGLEETLPHQPRDASRLPAKPWLGLLRLAGWELVVIRISLQLTRAPSSPNLNKDRDSSPQPALASSSSVLFVSLADYY